MIMMSGSKNERDLFQLQSIDKSTLSSQVVERIISLLTSCQLQPGDKLTTELELIELMEVSRPVLREALASLETLGIITRKNRRGTFFNSKVDAHPFSIMLSLSKNDLKSLVEGR